MSRLPLPFPGLIGYNYPFDYFTHHAKGEAMSSHAKKAANPGPLGLLGFGMTTVLLNLHNAGIIELSIVIVAMGLAVGGAAQIIAGITEFHEGNTFGGTAFCAYGLFWWSLCIIWVNPFRELIHGADEKSMGFYLLLWGVFTLFMFFGTLVHNTITKVVFLSLAVLFFLLAAGDFTGNHSIKAIAGYEGIFCGASAVYSAVGQIVNGEFNKTIFPL
ncbi:MAG: acetate uptake transporter [Spirochaetaceae bacterium]|nr:acetate uptake transporter [Spirochaetaceae bacterium]